MTNNEVRALVCPDSFKGTYSAAEVAGAVSAGLREEGVVPDPCPAADGGEGTLDVLLAARGGRSVGVVVRDPLGRDVRAALDCCPTASPSSRWRRRPGSACSKRTSAPR